MELETEKNMQFQKEIIKDSKYKKQIRKTFPQIQNFWCFTHGNKLLNNYYIYLLNRLTCLFT